MLPSNPYAMLSDYCIPYYAGNAYLYTSNIDEETMLVFCYWIVVS